jgi:predicted dehydrogenase
MECLAMNKSRREFLHDSMFATAAAMAAANAGAVYAQEETLRQSTSPNERLSVCVMGANGRGGSHIGGFNGRKDAQVTHICDVDGSVARRVCDSIEKNTGHRPELVEDIRKVLEQKTVDVVSIATPNHWHALGAIWAMQAGKDVYVEKPVSHNVSEGRRAVEAARKYKQICQTGTQSRSNPGMIKAIEFIRSGKIGDIKVARGLCYKPRGSIGPKGEYEVPGNVNYDLWCGPAPMAKVTRPKFHYDWHWIWDFGNGDLGNQGIHQMDIARWGLGLDRLCDGVLSYGGRLGYEDAGETANTQVVIHDYGDKTLVFEVRGLKTPAYRGASVGVIFEGTDGYFVSPSYNGGTAFDKDGKMLESFSGGNDNHHYENFVKAVRSRNHEDLTADIEEGHLSSALCHLGNISYRLGEEVAMNQVLPRLDEFKTNDNHKDTLERTIAHLRENNVDVANGKLRVGPALKLDPKTETFVENPAADKMLTRDYRAPYIVPPAGQV